MIVFEAIRELVLIVLVIWLFVYLIDNTSTEGGYAGPVLSLLALFFAVLKFLNEAHVVDFVSISYANMSGTMRGSKTRP